MFDAGNVGSQGVAGGGLGGVPLHGWRVANLFKWSLDYSPMVNPPWWTPADLIWDDANPPFDPFGIRDYLRDQLRDIERGPAFDPFGIEDWLQSLSNVALQSRGFVGPGVKYYYE